MSCRVFFRLDDIGPISRTASRLIDLFEEIGQPYILAVIPAGLNWWTARRLRETRYAMIFQHGFDHRNHSAEGAPDEFPDSMGHAHIAALLKRGRNALEQTLCVEVSGYVPPWNCISTAALRVLESEDYKILSANAPHSTSLRQLPIHVDVYSSYQPVLVKSMEDIQSEIDTAVNQFSLAGVMLHPLSTPRNRLDQLERLVIKNCEMRAPDISAPG